MCLCLSLCDSADRQTECVCACVSTDCAMYRERSCVYRENTIYIHTHTDTLCVCVCVCVIFGEGGIMFPNVKVEGGTGAGR